MFLVKNKNGNCNLCNGTGLCMYCEGTMIYGREKRKCPSCKTGKCLCVETKMPLIDPQKTDLDKVSIKNGEMIILK